MTATSEQHPPLSRPGLQPLLHDLASCVAAPGLLLASADGQVRRGGVSGWIVDDVRLLDRIEVALEGTDLELVRSATVGADHQDFGYVARGLGDVQLDPTVLVDRTRDLTARSLTERVTVSSVAEAAVDLVVHLDLGSDLGPLAEVRQGVTGDPVPPVASADALTWPGDGRGCTVRFDPPPERVDGGRVTWRARLARGERVTVGFTATTDEPSQFGSGRPAPWAEDAGVDAPDVRVTRVAAQSLADLAGLLLRDGEDRFLAAGSPWYFTLFGRDSLWAARMLVPFGTDLALSTLRTLARRQGRADDPATEEQPGKILHEVRNTELDLGAMTLPPVYYGTVDATPLFVCTLADAAAWGADPDRVRELLPAARACLEWVLAQSAESGWLRYVDHTGHGLANQGWKDSSDSVPFADGRLAEPPIALSEVQGYAYEAAVRGAALLEAYGEPPVEGLAAWAADLKRRFLAAFWVGGPESGHPAIALDGHGQPADAVTSNMGHLLGTGILDAAHAARVAEVLGGPDMDSGFGIRTLSSASPRFSRMSYHCGSVWPHDTAIAVRGLAADGYRDQAARVAGELVTAAEGVDYRLPELYGGDPADEVRFPTAYPASCRPQAWSAAAPLACLVAATGLVVDARNRVVRHPARTGTALGAYAVHGLRVGTVPMSVHVAADGAVRVDLSAGAGIDVQVEPARD
ncbi:MAG: glycogen debranching N-terminal domain-containing protein [Nocardioidaceae bacterium]